MQVLLLICVYHELTVEFCNKNDSPVTSWGPESVTQLTREQIHSLLLPPVVTLLQLYLPDALYLMFPSSSHHSILSSLALIYQ